ncbi:ArnT family glycosyltransferase [Pseudomonas sp. MWU13-2105]|uniref:ArnT family glycosyltransferase n=1 Tax=Pseudomonas sp. MWU13-2105 TaxID=2935074 RepID=UPI00200ED3A0|nr:phospholipid carrier-dependent glycosyltransferase [Pseudomonas sp. MWU13-2105]
MLFRTPIQLTLITVFVLASVVVGWYGLSTLSYPAVDNSIRFVLLFALSTAALSALSRVSPLIVAAGVIAVITLACGQAWPMMVVFLFGLSSSVLGHKILGRWKNNTWSVRLLLGGGILGTITGLAAHFPVNYPWSYTALLSLPFLINSRHAKELILQLKNEVVNYRPHSIPANALDIAACSLAGLYVITAFMPEIGYDALTMHLFIPAHLALQHQWGFDTETYVWALWPMLGDWIYSLVYMLAGETAARLINTSFILLVAWQIRELVIWAGGGTNQSRWAVLIFLSTPVVFAENSSLFIESVWTAFIMAGTLSLLNVSSSTRDERDRFIQLILTGALLGFALAAKAVTFSVLPILMLVLLIQYRAWVKSGVRPYLLIGLFCFLLVGSIPYAFSWYSTGNPVFPFFNTLFHSPLWPNSDFQAPTAFEKGVSWDTLYTMTFSSNRFIEGKVGAAGFQWILLPAAAMILLCHNHKKALVILLTAIGALVATYHATAYLRYVLPSFAMISAALALSFSGASWLAKASGATVGGMLLILNIWFIQSSTYYGQLIPSAILSSEGRDSYLTNVRPTRKIIEIVNTLNSARHPVAIFANPYSAGLKGDALYTSWYNLKWTVEYNAASTESALVDALLKRNIDWLIIEPSLLKADKLHSLLNISQPIAKVGDVELRKLSDAYRYTQETLKNSDFSSLDGWNLTLPSIYDPIEKTFTVDVKNPATQAVAIEAGRSYKTIVSSRCSTRPAKGRIQVNWINAKGNFITTNIEVYDCSNDWVIHEMIVTAPKDATTAIIYASGHTETPLAFKSVSFRK